MILTALIFLAFAFIHSVTVSIWFKNLCNKILGSTFMGVWYRFLYTTVSIVTALVAIVLLSKVPDRVFWTAPWWLRAAMHGIQVAGLVFGARAFEYMDAREFMGIRQVWRYLMRGEISGNIEGVSEKGLVTTGVYGIVRHPLYAAGLVIFTISPVITVNGLTLTVMADLYFLFGVFIEERRFVRIFGDEYHRYQARVPALIPTVLRRRRG